MGGAACMEGGAVKRALAGWQGGRRIFAVRACAGLAAVGRADGGTVRTG